MIVFRKPDNLLYVRPIESRTNPVCVRLLLNAVVTSSDYRLSNVWTIRNTGKKSKSFLCHALKGYKGCKYIAPLILNIDTRWM
jgi:hypothetical protein